MNLGDLLDEIRVGILNDRSDRTAGTSDYLWTDDRLVRYINEAQRRFARRALIIRDATTTEVVNVTIKTGVTDYDLHPSIIAVISAKISGARSDLIRVGHSALDSYITPTTIIYPTSFDTLPPGAPMAFATDESLVEDDSGSNSTVSMHIYPTPVAANDGTIVKLRAIRMPLDDLTMNNLSAIPEIPSDHHIEMLDWAAYLALRIVDDDAGNDKRASEFATSFESHVVEARKHVLRKLYAPQKWGFGQNGWSGYVGDHTHG